MRTLAACLRLGFVCGPQDERPHLEVAAGHATAVLLRRPLRHICRANRAELDWSRPNRGLGGSQRVPLMWLDSLLLPQSL
jgi:hypothetical protein